MTLKLESHYRLTDEDAGEDTGFIGLGFSTWREDLPEYDKRWLPNVLGHRYVRVDLFGFSYQWTFDEVGAADVI